VRPGGDGLVGGDGGLRAVADQEFDGAAIGAAEAETGPGQGGEGLGQRRCRRRRRANPEEGGLVGGTPLGRGQAAGVADCQPGLLAERRGGEDRRLGERPVVSRTPDREAADQGPVGD
jgi:hypothetical protein